MPRSFDLLQELRRRDHDPDAAVLVAHDPGSGGDVSTLWTLGGLEYDVDERAEELRDAGVEPGKIHPLVVESDADGVVTLLAHWRMGSVPAPLNPRLTERERDAAIAVLEGRDAGGAQAVLWTSGTSGTPRGVALRFSSMVSHSDAVMKRLGVEVSDRWVASLSLAHVGGLMTVVRTLLSELLLVATPPLRGDELYELLSTELGLGLPFSPTHVSLVPTQLSRLLDAAADGPPPEGFRCALLGGAHTSDQLLARAHAAGWPVALTYGMTEMTSQVATAPPKAVRRKPGSPGRALEGVELRITEGGEVQVRSRHASDGYLDGTRLTDKHGWYATGDLGRIDDDGDLWITGRVSDRIISGGVNVDPREVEDAVRAHPTVVDVCVVGVEDEEWGERVAAWVIPVEGEFDLDEVQEWLRDRLAGPKRPRTWWVDDTLPLNANGKVDRALVRSLFAGTSPDGGDA